jgi:hypothetical protein
MTRGIHRSPHYFRRRREVIDIPNPVSSILGDVDLLHVGTVLGITQKEPGRFLVITGWISSRGMVPGDLAHMFVERLVTIAKGLPTPVCMAMRCSLDCIYNIALLGGSRHRHVVSRHFRFATESSSVFLLDHEYCIRLANALFPELIIDPPLFSSLLHARHAPAAQLSAFIVNCVSADGACAVAFLESGCGFGALMQELGPDGRCDVIVCVMNALDEGKCGRSDEIIADIGERAREIMDRGMCSEVGRLCITTAIHEQYERQKEETVWLIQDDVTSLPLCDMVRAAYAVERVIRQSRKGEFDDFLVELSTIVARIMNADPGCANTLTRTIRDTVGDIVGFEEVLAEALGEECPGIDELTS